MACAIVTAAGTPNRCCAAIAPGATMLMNACWSRVPGVAYWRPDVLAGAADGDEDRDEDAASGADGCVGRALGVAAGGAVGAAAACAGAAPGIAIVPPPAAGSRPAAARPAVGSLAVADGDR